MIHSSHALIITGGTSNSRLSEARTLSAGDLCLNCEGDPCWVCDACRKVAENSHPDVFYLRPEGRSILVDQVRALRVALQHTPHEGRRQVAVIEADALNANAQNALLSVLEDPPGQVHFLLLSENPALLLTTVRSRCTVRRLPDPHSDVQPSEQAVTLMNALLSGDEWMWAEACFSMEKQPREELTGHLDDLAAMLVNAVPGRDILTARRFGGIIDQIRIFQEMLDANVGAGHVCGALAVCASSDVSIQSFGFSAPKARKNQKK